jgi:nucleoside phosphorylase
MLDMLRHLFRSSEPPRMPEIRGLKGSARVAVMTVVDDELDQLRPTLACTQNIPLTSYWARTIEPSGSYDLVLKQIADRGNQASGEGARDIIEDFRPHFLLLVGIGGGIEGRDETQVGDVIVVDYVDYYEFRKLMDGQDMPRRLPFDHPSRLLRADIAKPMVDLRDWPKSMTFPRPKVGACKAIVGNLVSGEKLLADGKNETQRSIVKEYDKAIAVDMESFGVARAVYAARGSVHYNLQYAVVRGVSDLVAAEDNDEMRKAWRPYAAHAAATFAAGMIEKLLALRT